MSLWPFINSGVGGCGENGTQPQRDPLGTGDDIEKIFNLEFTPVGSVTIFLDGAEYEGNYTVDADQKKVTFETAPYTGAVIRALYGRAV